MDFQEQVRNSSSRRKRKQPPSKKEISEAFRRKHFPNESPYAVNAAWYILTEGGNEPTPELVYQFMEDHQWTAKQRGLENDG